MSEIDLHAITRRLEIIKAESSQGGPRLQAVLDAGVLGIEA